MIKKIWFDWKRFDTLPYWLHGASADYEVGDGGVVSIAYDEGSKMNVVISYQDGGRIGISGIPSIVEYFNDVKKVGVDEGFVFIKEAINDIVSKMNLSNE